MGSLLGKKQGKLESRLSSEYIGRVNGAKFEPGSASWVKRQGSSSFPPTRRFTMQTRTRFGCALACAILLLGTFLVQPARADLITGIYPTVTPISASEFQLTGGVILTGPMIGPPLTGDTVGPLDFSVATGALTLSPSTPNLDITSKGTTFPNIMLFFFNPSTGVILAKVDEPNPIADTVNHTYDLTGFTGGGQLEIDLFGVNVDLANKTVTFGEVPSAQFTISSQFVIPEPGSLVLWGMIALAGAAWIGRRRGVTRGQKKTHGAQAEWLSGVILPYHLPSQTITVPSELADAKVLPSEAKAKN
jgi:hypothetical protein